MLLFQKVSHKISRNSTKFDFSAAYVVIKFKNAKNYALGSMADPSEILESMEFAEYLYNENPRDTSIRYFHMFAASDDFFVLPMNSMELDPFATLESCRVGEPPMNMMQYDDSLKGYFKVFSKKRMGWFPIKFEADRDFMQLHMIQAVFDEEKNVITLDTLQTGNADILKGKIDGSINHVGHKIIYFSRIYCLKYQCHWRRHQRLLLKTRPLRKASSICLRSFTKRPVCG